MSRIEREKQIARRMIELYCRHRLKQDTMPDEYRHLAEFACRRLGHCKYGEHKTACKDCPTHCYAPKEREQIRKVMRWVGPRMIFYSPKEAIRHLFYKYQKLMNRLIFFVLISLAVCACSTLTREERAERDAKTAQAVEKVLTERRYTVGIQMMFPRGGKAVNVTPDYSLQVKGDTLVSYLPYFGRAYSVPYGGGKGFDFTAPIKEYKAVKERKGNTRILIRVDNEEDILTYVLDVFPNGSTTIDVSARERESISYSGQVEVHLFSPRQ